MANNYQLWSEIVENLSDEEIEWIKDALTWSPTEEEERDPNFECPAWYDRDAEGCGFDYNLDKKARSLHVYSEENGNLDSLVDFLQEFINRFRPEMLFVITWAETCSKPRIGQFGGGAVVIHRDGARWLTAWAWAREQIEEINALKGIKEEKKA
jgi:hypothetical protein